MKTENNIKYVRRYIEMFAKAGTTIIDATCGNGNDSLFLAEHYPQSQIIGFDIQPLAIENSQNRCSHCNNVEFILDSHGNVDNYVQSNVSLAIFNLGYLPRGEQSITTIASSTITAIEKILARLVEGGGIIITLYRGQNNVEETDTVLSYLRTINKDFYIVSMYDLINLNGNPFNVIIERK